MGGIFASLVDSQTKAQTDQLKGRLLEPPFVPNFRVVLVEPEIPQNTGNLGRTCVGSCSELHLVGPMGFKITDTQLKRAGLDYWPHLSWCTYDSFDKLTDDWNRQIAGSNRVFYFSSKATKPYWEADFRQGDWLVFGKETKGLSEEVLRQNQDRVFQIPIYGPVRSYNVATAAAMVIFEGMRQLTEKGQAQRYPYRP